MSAARRKKKEKRLQDKTEKEDTRGLKGGEERERADHHWCVSTWYVWMVR